MTFALDPSTEQGRSVLGYLTDLHTQGAPIRFGLILAPGAAGGRGIGSGSAHRPPPLVQGSATRLVALESAYANPMWQSAALVSELEGRAASAAAAGGSTAWGREGGDDGGGGGSALSEEEAGEEALGVLLTKLFLFCRRKLGSGAELRFLELTREVCVGPLHAPGGGYVLAAGRGAWKGTPPHLVGGRVALLAERCMEGNPHTPCGRACCITGLEPHGREPPHTLWEGVLHYWLRTAWKGTPTHLVGGRAALLAEKRMEGNPHTPCGRACCITGLETHGREPPHTLWEGVLHY
eukprot:scaffold14357_cov101-Isochrysis_galbana.AAC.7